YPACIYASFSCAPATTEIHSLSLHDALPILNFLDSSSRIENLSSSLISSQALNLRCFSSSVTSPIMPPTISTSTVFTSKALSLRSEEHTSELQSRENLVCRLLLEKKKIHGNT